MFSSLSGGVFREKNYLSDSRYLLTNDKTSPLAHFESPPMSGWISLSKRLITQCTRQGLITRRNRFPFDCKSVCFHFATFFLSAFCLRGNFSNLSMTIELKKFFWRFCIFSWKLKHDKLILLQLETIFNWKPR